ncbi:MAG TPA: MBL fold metallo-hydrolase [Clostridia bacterium]
MRKSKTIINLILAFVFSFSVLFPVNGAIVYYGSLQVHFLDVGQGDCSIIKLPDGKTVIVDAGNNYTSSKQKILDYIEKNFKIKYFDYAIITHTDADHCGGIKDVLSKYPAKTIYRPNVIANNSGFVDPAIALTQNASLDDNLKFWSLSGADIKVKSNDSPAYKNFIEQAYKSFTKNNTTFTPQVIVSDGRIIDRPQGKPSQDIKGDDYSITFYSPLKPTYDDSNDYSNIFILEFKGFEFFFSGDAEKKAEEDFVKTYADFEFDIDVFKLGHHGSRTSSSADLLELVTKESKRNQIFAVASCGKGNSYGHPHKEVLDRLLDLGFLEENILRTDTVGDIVFEVKADNLGNYSLNYKDTSIPVDQNDFWKFFEDLYNNSPEIFYIVIGIIIVLGIAAVVIVYRQKSKK